jgi:transcriptional regulator with XRE-family HTH domain
MPIATQPQDPLDTSPQVLAGRTYRMLREAHGVSLRSLAAMVDVSPSHLSRVEQGERAAGPSLDRRIVEAIASLPVERAS